jgi:AraC-like DNA-binding protein
MKTAAPKFPSLHCGQGTLLVDARMIEQLADLMHDTAFFIKDTAGRYVVVNQSLVERHGLQHKSQMLGRRPCDVCPGDYGRIPTEQDEQVLRTGQPIVERLELFWRRPHVPVWGLTSKLPLRNAHGQVTGLIGISKDLAAPVSREDVPPEVARVLRHLESAYDEPVSPSSLARKAGMTAARLARVIKRIHGISPMQLITKTRITAGCRLLRESDASVAQIALNCGFADHSAFTRAFRAVTGCSPSEYRRLNLPSVARATAHRAHVGT